MARDQYLTGVKVRVGRTSAGTMSTLSLGVTRAPVARRLRHQSQKLTPIVTGAHWQCAPIQHLAGACVTYANGIIEIKF